MQKLPIEFPCPVCCALPTMPCRNPDGTLFRGYHVERWPVEPKAEDK
jgi:hypothetical protein